MERASKNARICPSESSIANLMRSAISSKYGSISEPVSPSALHISRSSSSGISIISLTFSRSAFGERFFCSFPTTELPYAARICSSMVIPVRTVSSSPPNSSSMERSKPSAFRVRVADRREDKESSLPSFMTLPMAAPSLFSILSRRRYTPIMLFRSSSVRFP